MFEMFVQIVGSVSVQVHEVSPAANRANVRDANPHNKGFGSGRRRMSANVYLR